MASTEQNDRWALVTGASSGLGREFSLQLAESGYHLVLVARREDRLRALVSEIGERHGRQALAVPLDLTAGQAVSALTDALADAGITPEVLINNAGFGLHGGFLHPEWERERAMLELNVGALVHLTRVFAEQMIRAGRGFILQVASIAAYQSSPSYASYAASKSYVLHYGEAIAEELSGTGVSCTVLSPGVVRTEFLQVAGQGMTTFHRLTIMESERVVRTALRALFRGRLSVVPGISNKVAVWLNRLVPRRAVVRVVRRLMGFRGGPHDPQTPADPPSDPPSISTLRAAFREYAHRHPDEAETAERFKTLLEAGPPAFYRSHPDAHFTASAVVLSPDRSQVLLTHHRKLGIWIQLGGHADGDLDLLRAAQKEAVEESGLTTIRVGAQRIIDIDIHPIPAHGDEPPHEHYDVRYLFLADPDAPLTVSEESHDLSWVAVTDLATVSWETSLTRAVEKAVNAETDFDR